MKQGSLPKLDAEPRRITARHDGVCRRCSGAIRRGAGVWWYPHNGYVVHEKCMGEGTEGKNSGAAEQQNSGKGDAP